MLVVFAHCVGHTRKHTKCWLLFWRVLQYLAEHRWVRLVNSSTNRLNFFARSFTVQNITSPLSFCPAALVKVFKHPELNELSQRVISSSMSKLALGHLVCLLHYITAVLPPCDTLLLKVNIYSELISPLWTGSAALQQLQMHQQLLLCCSFGWLLCSSFTWFFMTGVTW